LRQICRGWLQEQLGDVLRVKTLGNRNYGMLEGPIYVRILKDSYIMFCVNSINTAYLECTTSTTPTCMPKHGATIVLHCS